MTPQAIRDRIYADFFMPSRLDAYRGLLEAALDAGYEVQSIEAFLGSVGAAAGQFRRRLILRHDVDTDPRTAAEMWRAEQELGVDGTYFFRLSTLDVDLMRRIEAAGGHAGYHYEELATVAKRRRTRSRAEAEGLLPEARRLFARNLARVRTRSGLPIRVVASHGDFVNRHLGVPNWAILDDPDFRAEVGVDLEAYDRILAEHVTSRHADTGYPRYWIPDDPRDAIRRSEPTIHLLVHPRHWRTDRVVNARDDLRRIAESVSFRLPWLPRPGEECGDG